MTTISTRTKTFREQAGAIKALATARRPDGSVFKHSDILATLGLPHSKEWQRSLSNYLTSEGIRRRKEYTHKRSDFPELPGIDQDEMTKDPSEPEVTLQQVLNMNQSLWAIKSAIADLTLAFDELCSRWNDMTGQEDAND